MSSSSRDAALSVQTLSATLTTNAFPCWISQFFLRFQWMNFDLGSFFMCGLFSCAPYSFTTGNKLVSNEGIWDEVCVFRLYFFINGVYSVGKGCDDLWLWVLYGILNLHSNSAIQQKSPFPKFFKKLITIEYQKRKQNIITIKKKKNCLREQYFMFLLEISPYEILEHSKLKNNII